VDIPAIRATIELAKRREATTGYLQQALTRQLPALHTAIQLPRAEPLAALLAFSIAYIEHVPNCLEAAAAITREARLEKQTSVLLQLAEDYFLKPAEPADGRIGLGELMHAAYLVHRLLEEINDRYRIRAGIPLLPIDMTVANLIGHQLLGEPFANELDEAVLFSVEQLLCRHPLPVCQAFQDYITAHLGGGWNRERQRWPSLARDITADLQLACL
jgi:hypothetical protein